MNRMEFDIEIQRLQDAMAGRIPKDFDIALNTWFEKTRWASKIVFHKAIDDLMRHERFPVLGQLLSACNDHQPTNEQGWFMNHDFCYKNIESDGMRCGCVVCHHEFWCNHPECVIPVEARMSNIAVHDRQKSLQFCYIHGDDAPEDIS